MHSEMNDIRRALGAIGREEAPADLRRRILRACAEAGPVEEISCEETLELASEYLDDELHGIRRDAFEAHVFACDSCYVAFKQMERTVGLLRETGPASAPADLHERITAAVARDDAALEEAAGDSAAESVFTWRRAAKVLGGLAAAAALLAAVFVPRGGDGIDSPAPVIAERPAETVADPADHAEAVEEIDEQVAAAEETDDSTVAEEGDEATRETPIAAAPQSVREAPSTRTTSPRTPPAADSRPESEPSAGTASATASEPEREEPVPAPAARPHPDRPAAAPRRNVDAPETRERTVTQPEREPEPEPETATGRSTPTPERERTPEATPDPPARDPQPRETVVAATPRDPEPEPTVAPRPAPEPASTGSVAESTGESESLPVAVVPRRPHSRAVYQPEPTPAADRSARLARMSEGINASQNPGLDNPSSGIELN